MKRYITEFKAFAMRGNVMDLAVGVIIGGAFGKIVDSLVTDVVMPVIGMAIGGIDFTDLIIKIGNAKIKYGVFIQAIFNFAIVAAAIFVLIKALNRLKREKPAEEKPAQTPEDIQLLREIRDSLKNR